MLDEDKIPKHIQPELFSTKKSLLTSFYSGVSCTFGKLNELHSRVPLGSDTPTGVSKQ